MRNDPPEEERFYKNTLVMGELIYESVVQLRNAGHTTIEPELVKLANIIISSYDKEGLIQGFIENSYIECWDRIKNRDENFFVENVATIFKYLPKETVNLFRDLFIAVDENGKSIIQQSLKEELWCLFDAMVKISIKYIHKGRSPYSYSSSNEVVNAYTDNFFEEIDIIKHANNWNVKLDFPLHY